MPVRRGGVLQPAGGPDRGRAALRPQGRARRLAAPRAVPGEDPDRGERLHLRGLRRHAVGAVGRDRRPGPAGRPALGVVPPGGPDRRGGAVPERGRQAHPHHRRPARALHPAPAAPGAGAGVARRPRRPGRAGHPGVAGRPQHAAPHRPGPVRAHLPQARQPPLVERHPRDPGAAAELRRAARPRGAGGGREEPADAAPGARGPPGAGRPGLLPGRHASARRRDHGADPALDPGGPVELPGQGRGRPGLLADPRRRRHPPLPAADPPGRRADAVVDARPARHPDPPLPVG